MIDLHQARKIFDNTTLIFSGLLLISVVIIFGYRLELTDLQVYVFQFFRYSLFIFFFLDLLWTFHEAPDKIEYFKNHFYDVFLLLFIILPITELETRINLIVIRQLIKSAVIFFRGRRVSSFVRYMTRNSAKLLMFSFAFTILTGCLFLTFPAATADGKGASLLDALFTSTSATCVTGLIVQDTPVYFTIFGQSVILALIQIGGLGIMTLSASLAVIFGKSMGLTSQSAMQNLLDSEDTKSVNKILSFILKETFIIEIVGAIVMAVRFSYLGMPFSEAAYKGVFHSVSAFCNAGFALYTDSFVGMQTDWVINITLALLIITGGLGFAVIAAIVNRDQLKKLISRKRNRYFFRELNTHTKIVLLMTLLLILSGMIIVFFLEFDNTLDGMNVPGKFLASFFQSVTLRTAGFNTIDISSLKEITLFLMAIFMFIGAGSGSTAGGIKITTFTTFLFSVKAMVSGRKDIEIFGRRIPQPVVYKSIAIIVISIVILLTLFLLLLSTQEFPFVHLLFEAVSAFGTVGLSTGITPLLTNFGKVVIILLMYIGRIGPLTLALSINEKKQESGVIYPSAKIMVG